MIYCQRCGTPLQDDAKFCENCGAATGAVVTASAQDNTQLKGLKLAAYVLMIVGTIATSIPLVFPLAWCIPMTVAYYNKVTSNQPVSVGFKVCSLLFVSTIAGILMLVDTDDN